MGYYRAGDIIKKTREALGMTQEELSDGICAVENLSRMENNHTKIKLETYRRLMRKMERMPEKVFAVGIGANMEILEEQYLLERYHAKHEYETAMKYIEQLEEKIGKDVINQQYLRRMKALCRYRLKHIDATTVVEELEVALSLTLKDYESALKKRMPLTEQEMLLCMNIASMTYEKGNVQRGFWLLDLVKEYVDRLPMDKVRMQAAVYGIYGRKLSLEKEYKKAREYLERALEFAIERNDGVLIITCWDNLLWLDRRCGCNEEDNIQKFLQLYYFAAARNDKQLMALIRKGYSGYVQYLDHW